MAHDKDPYVKVPDAVLFEDLSNDELAAMVRLSCHMHHRWRSDRNLTLAEVGHETVLSKLDQMRITGKGRPDVAWKLLERLADIGSMSAERRGDVGAIQWPKWAEFHGSRGTDTPSPKPQPQTHPEKHVRREKKEKSPPAPRASIAPDALTEDQLRDVESYCSGKGIALSVSELRECWEIVALWSQGKGKTARVWPLAFKGYLRAGWPQERLQSRGQGDAFNGDSIDAIAARLAKPPKEMH